MASLTNYLERNLRWLIWVAIPVLSILLHWDIWNKDLMGIHVWRQAQTQSYVQNFVEEDMNILNPRVNHRFTPDGIYRYEFPVMQWVFAVFIKLFGNHIILSRILSFLIALGTLWGFQRWVKALWRDDWLSSVAVWAFAWSPVFYYYSINPLPDNLALMGGIAGLAFFSQWTTRRKYTDLLLASLFLMLGTLAKLPFLLFYAWPAGWFLREWIYPRSGGLSKNVTPLIPLILSVFPWMLWYVWVIPSWTGNGIVTGILDMNASQWESYWSIALGHLVSTFPELFLNFGSLLFFLIGLLFLVKKKIWRSPWALPVGLWVAGILSYFFFELNMIGAAHDYYLFPFLPGIFLITAYGLREWKQIALPGLKYLGMIALIILPLLAFLRGHSRWNPQKNGPSLDLIQYRDQLRAATPPGSLIAVGSDPSLHIYLYYFDRRGFAWNMTDPPGPGHLQRFFDAGVRYFFSDQPQVDEAENLRPWLGNRVNQWGSIRMYHLMNGDSLRNRGN